MPNDNGEYNILLTPNLVNAAVISPHGTATKKADNVVAVANTFGTVHTASEEGLTGFHTASILILSRSNGSGSGNGGAPVLADE